MTSFSGLINVCSHSPGLHAMAQAVPPNHQGLLPKIPRSYAEDQNSPLHVACYKGSYDEALMLILSGHDVSARNVWKETPLHQCTSQGHLDIMMLLLDAGAAVNSLDHQHLTPMHQAVIHGNRDAVELLLCYGASVHNSKGITDTISAVELATHVHVCHEVVKEALGKVWSLQHLCKTTIRRFLGVSRRRRIKELPLPKVVISYLCMLPIAKSPELHENWERVRSSKTESIRKRGASRRGRQSNSKYTGGIHMIRQL